MGNWETNIKLSDVRHSTLVLRYTPGLIDFISKKMIFLRMLQIHRHVILFGCSTISRKPISRMASIMKILGGIIVMLVIREIGFGKLSEKDLIWQPLIQIFYSFLVMIYLTGIARKFKSVTRNPNS
jgi:hypothetical protein